MSKKIKNSMDDSREKKVMKMPIINIQILEGRPEKNIASLISDLATTAAKHLEVSEERVRVIVQEVSHNRWAVGGKVMSERKNKEK